MQSVNSVRLPSDWAVLRAQLTSQLLLGGLRQQEGHAVHQGGPNLRAALPPPELHLPTASFCDCTHSTAVSVLTNGCLISKQLDDASQFVLIMLHEGFLLAHTTCLLFWIC